MNRMRFAIFSVVTVIAACGGGNNNNTTDASGNDAPVSAACQEATTYQNLANIEDKIFKTSCIFSGCHNGANTDAGKVDLRSGMAHDHLVNFDSIVENGRKLVVAGDPAASYMMVMIGQIDPGSASPPTTAPPTTIGLMPQNTGGMLLCQQKRDAIERWIMAGAAND